MARKQISRRTRAPMRAGGAMPDKTYKIIEVVGVSEESIQQAVRNALAKARQTLRNIDWFEVCDIRGAVTKTGEPIFQVEIRIGFRLEGSPAN
ncbi:MAG: dodecin [Candidatus Binataceae bacterium]